MSVRGRQLAALGLALLVSAVLAWFARDVDGLRRPRPPEAGGWFSIDPDGLYHARRVERALREGLPVAETDPYLNYPHGARIPWPPYYDTVLALLLRPFAPAGGDGAADARRRAWVERSVATLPACFGLGAALLAVAAAFRVTRGSGLAARLAAGLTAGAAVALSRAAINYSVIGNGDHHAWVAFLNALLLLIATVACCRGSLARRGPSLALGLAAGLVAGLMLGSWVAALLYVANLQLALAWFLFRRARDELPGVAAFGLAFHLAAAATILPAVLSSPWRQEFPWMVVNLSWFHPTLLLVGALVFVPPLLCERGRLAPGTAAARRYPWLVGLALAGGAGLLWAVGTGPAEGLAEGLAWVTRVDAFMDTVLESAPLVGPRSGGPEQLFGALGYGILLVPLAWAWFALAAFRQRLDALVPFAVALPPLLAQALAQRRFADVLSVPMAVCLGWAAARLIARLSAWQGTARIPRLAWPALALGIAVALQWPTLERLVAWSRVGPSGFDSEVLLGDRLAYEWMRARDPAPDRDPEVPRAVLAHWDRGHAIEWAADRPTVATNFGSYVGLDSYRDPARFFLTEDPLEGQALLERRRVRYVFAPGSLPSNVESFVRIADPGLASRYLVPANGQTITSPRWLSTLGARLLNGGVQLVPPNVPLEQRSPPLGFLRLVYVSPQREWAYRAPEGAPGAGQPMPVGFVWERVPGATLAARGGPHELARVDLTVRYRGADYALELAFLARCDAAGVARLWIPYTTEGPNGEGLVERASWQIGSRSGSLVIPESAVQGGPPVEIP